MVIYPHTIVIWLYRIHSFRSNLMQNPPILTSKVEFKHKQKEKMLKIENTIHCGAKGPHIFVHMILFPFAT